MPLIDIGVNLTNKAFRRDLDDVISRATEAGVSKMIVTGTSLDASRRALDLAVDRAGTLFCTAGVHPHHASECDESTLDRLRNLAAEESVVAIGECGLDYNRDFSPRPVQDRWFEAQVELAGELDMPLFLHEREAHPRLMEILRRHRSSFSNAVVHCFTGTEAEVDAYLELDLHIGITGWICDERRGQHLKELIAKIPLDRLMLETDAPYLTPRNMRPRTKKGRNEPAFLTYVLDVVADSLSMPKEQVAASTTETARRFFRLG